MIYNNTIKQEDTNMLHNNKTKQEKVIMRNNTTKQEATNMHNNTTTQEDTTMDNQINIGCQVLITYEDIDINGLTHDGIKALLEKYCPTYYCYAYGAMESGEIYLQLFIMFEEPKSMDEIRYDFAYADTITLTNDFPPEIRSDIMLMDSWETIRGKREFLYFATESGSCPPDPHIAPEFYADEEEMLTMIEQGYTNEEILEALPSTANYVFEMDGYRQYYLDLPENLYE